MRGSNVSDLKREDDEAAPTLRRGGGGILAARGGDEAQLATEIERHARDAHGMTLTPHEALLLTFRADLGRLRIAETDSS